MVDTGWLGATSSREVANGGSSWANIGNIYTSNNNHASCTLAKGSNPSFILEAYGMGGAVPAGSTINGIQVLIERQCSYDEGGDQVNDSAIRLMKNLAIVGDNKASGAKIAGETTIYYGGAEDLWGTTWSVAEVNHANFGISAVFTESVGGSNCNLSVDYIDIKVFYTEGGGFDNIAKINGIPIVNIAKINGIPIEDIAEVNGVS